MTAIAKEPACAEHLLADDMLGRSSHQSLARLLPHVTERHLAAGAPIYRAGEGAECLYLLLEGTVMLVSPLGRQCGLLSRRFGEEAGTEAHCYLTDAIAATDIVVLCIPRRAMRNLTDANPCLKAALLLSLSSHLAGEQLPQQTPPTTPVLSGYRRHAVSGWVLVMVLSLLVLELGEQFGLARNSTIFMAIFAATVTMWVCNLADEYVPALFALLATLVTGLVPAPVILSGFASEGFLMALSTLALGTVVVASGLGYRVMLLLLRRLPNHQFWHNAGLLAIGLVLTPIIPTANGRIALLAPIFADMVDHLRLRRQGRAATRLMLTCFSGASLFSAIFVTSKSLNFAVFALLTPQGQDRFQWWTWTLAAAATGAVLLVTYAFAALCCDNSERPYSPNDRVDQQRLLLGPLAGAEWAAIAGIAFMMAGIVTSSMHKMQPPWLGFAMLFGLLLCGTLSKKELKEKVDWTFLLYLSGISGIVAAFHHLGLDRELGALLPDLGSSMRDHFGLFVLILFVLINLVRLALPTNATTMVLATILMPLASASGVNEWLVGFMILVFSEGWFFPYQCSYYLQLQEMNRTEPLYDEPLFLSLNALMNLGRLPAVYAAFPFWQSMGLL